MKYLKVNDTYYDHFYNILWDHIGHQFTVWKNDFRRQKSTLSDVIEIGVENNEEIGVRWKSNIK